MKNIYKFLIFSLILSKLFFCCNLSYADFSTDQSGACFSGGIPANPTLVRYRNCKDCSNNVGPGNTCLACLSNPPMSGPDMCLCRNLNIMEATDPADDTYQFCMTSFSGNMTITGMLLLDTCCCTGSTIYDDIDCDKECKTFYKCKDPNKQVKKGEEKPSCMIMSGEEKFLVKNFLKASPAAPAMITTAKKCCCTCVDCTTTTGECMVDPPAQTYDSGRAIDGTAGEDDEELSSAMGCFCKRDCSTTGPSGRCIGYENGRIKDADAPLLNEIEVMGCFCFRNCGINPGEGCDGYDSGRINDPLNPLQADEIETMGCFCKANCTNTGACNPIDATLTGNGSIKNPDNACLANHIEKNKCCCTLKNCTNAVGGGCFTSPGNGRPDSPVCNLALESSMNGCCCPIIDCTNNPGGGCDGSPGNGNVNLTECDFATEDTVGLCCCPKESPTPSPEETASASPDPSILPDGCTVLLARTIDGTFRYITKCLVPPLPTPEPSTSSTPTPFPTLPPPPPTTTPSSTESPSPSASPSTSPSPTESATSTPEESATATPSSSESPSPSASPSTSLSPTESATSTPEESATATPSSTESPSPSASSTTSPSPTESATSTPEEFATATPSSSESPSPSPSPSTSSTTSPSPTESATSTPLPTLPLPPPPTPTPLPTLPLPPTPTPSASPSSSPSPTTSPTPSTSSTPTPTPTPSSSESPSPSTSPSASVVIEDLLK